MHTSSIRSMLSNISMNRKAIAHRKIVQIVPSTGCVVTVFVQLASANPSKKEKDSKTNRMMQIGMEANK